LGSLVDPDVYWQKAISSSPPTTLLVVVVALVPVGCFFKVASSMTTQRSSGHFIDPSSLPPIPLLLRLLPKLNIDLKSASFLA